MAIPFSDAVEAAIKEHKKHLGRNEYPAGSNKTAFGKAFGWDGVFYCAIALYATTCIWGGSTAAHVKSASSWAIYLWHKAVGRAVSGNPQRGDYIHVWKNGKSVHIERVLSFTNGRLICIGSNTSNASGGSTANGGGTYINDRTAWWNNRNSNRGWSIKGVSRPLYGLTVEDVKAVQRKAGIKVDGKYGPDTRVATIQLQKVYGLKGDGFPGPKTQAALQGASVPPAASKPAADAGKGVKATPFPLPREKGAMFYYGPADGPIESVSGKTRNSKVPHDVTQDANGKYRSIGLYQWQRQMKDRGWNIDVDGKFGPQTEKVVRQFQKNKGLEVDGKIGPATWKAAWELPVT